MSIDGLGQSIAMELQGIKERVKDATEVRICGSKVVLVNSELNVEVKINAYTKAKYNHELATRVSDFILADVLNEMIREAGICVVSKEVYVKE